MQIDKIAIIGGGKMGEAILAGLIASESPLAAGLNADSFIVANPGQEKRNHLTQLYGVQCVSNGTEISGAQVVILAVKPQVLPQVVSELVKCPAFDTTASVAPLFISIAAGITTPTLVSLLGSGARVVRVMPNTPLMVGSGMTAVVGDGGASAQDVELTRGLFACLGSAEVVSESDMDAVCALSGSGPAYVAAFIEALRDGAVAEGLDYDLAEKLALQTVLGTAQLIHETQQAPAAVRQAVCSPGGTTLAGLDAMNAADFSSAVARGVTAAKLRSIELGAAS